MTIAQLDNIDISNKRLLIRQDLNVPLDAQGNITDDARIQAALPTLKYALKQNAAIMVISHLGRPTEGEYNPNHSIAPVADRLSQLLNKPVRLVADWLNPPDIAPGEIVIGENVRFQQGEASNDATLAKKMAQTCDIVVMDAFATAHRKQASTYGVIQHAKQSCMGLLMASELSALAKATQSPASPVVAIVGGAKISTKLILLESLLEKVDILIPGGGIANTFLAATGVAVGKSLYEPDLLDTAKAILEKAETLNKRIQLPTDVIVAKSIDDTAEPTQKPISDVADDDLILDIGSHTCQQFCQLIAEANTIIWNGPVGLFEIAAFSEGTKSLANAIAHSKGFSLTGGGDTVAAINQFHLSNQMDYISTGGGAFLNYLEGQTLPTVAALQQMG